ncbi:MAG: DUF721 domain-containing protein [Thermodesulfobacteriota bacterium]
MPRRTKAPKPKRLGEILQEILKKRNIPHSPADRHLLDVWNRAVGSVIAAQTHPDRIRGGTLFVRVSAPVWLHQLQFMKADILGRVQALSAGEKIQALFFTVGDIPAAAPGRAGQPPPALPLSGLPEGDRRMMRESLATVRDPELQEILKRVMAREISRRRQGG